MDVIRKKVYTYGGYEEHWSDDYKLSISYQRPRDYDMELIDGVWTPTLTLNPLMVIYLRSVATYEFAAERCGRCNLPISEIGKLIPTEQELLPEELFRFLMDEHGFGMEDAINVVIGVFGKAVCNVPENDWLHEMQPRTAALNKLLRATLFVRSVVIHEPYDEEYRKPAGAVDEGTEIEFSVYATEGAGEITMHVWGEDFSRDVPMDRDGERHFCRFAPPCPAVYFYSFFHRGGETKAYQLTVFKRGFDTPDWFKGGVMYQVFPDRFGIGEDVSEGNRYHRSRGRTPELHGSISEPVKWQARIGEEDYAPDDFYGGTLKGIVEKLPYLKSLGVSILYLNPIVEARSNHRYDTANYERVDPILGSNNDYVNLCAEAAKLGINIVNDGVFSHTGADSIYFNKYSSYVNCGAYQGEASPYYNWYDFKAFPEKYRCWWGFKELPEVNELERSWQDYVVSGKDSIIKKWLRMGASGWRLDVADELPDEVLELIRNSVKAEKSDAVIIGEVWEDAVLKEEQGRRRRYALGGALDSVMNYPFREAVLNFALGKTNSYELRDFLLHQRFNYPKPMYMSLMNLLGSHDVERLHTYLALGHDAKGMSRSEQAQIAFDDYDSRRGMLLQKMCAAIQYAVPGVPCLYYGDEECLDGGRDPFNRAPFEPQQKKLYSWYARLGELRSTCSALRNGDMQLETPTPNVLHIIRENGEERITCVVNNSAFVREFSGGTPLLGCDRRVAPVSAEIFIKKKK